MILSDPSHLQPSFASLFLSCPKFGVWQFARLENQIVRVLQTFAFAALFVGAVAFGCRRSDGKPLRDRLCACP